MGEDTPTVTGAPEPRRRTSRPGARDAGRLPVSHLDRRPAGTTPMRPRRDLRRRHRPDRAGRRSGGCSSWPCASCCSNTFRVLESTKMHDRHDARGDRAAPAGGQELGRDARTASSTASTACSCRPATSSGRVERLSGLVEQAASSPLVKVVSVGAGLRGRLQRKVEGAGTRRAESCAGSSGSRSAWAAGDRARSSRRAGRGKPGGPRAPADDRPRGEGGPARSVASSCSESIEEGKRAMEERERELRDALARWTARGP